MPSSTPAGRSSSSGEFQPILGPTCLYGELADRLTIDDPPNRGGGTPHVGSAYDTSWFGYVANDLRRIFRQECFDSIAVRTFGAISVPAMPGVNRTTYQHAVEIRRHR